MCIRDRYVGARMAVIESVTKLVATGFRYEDAYLTFQEYFERLGLSLIHISMLNNWVTENKSVTEEQKRDLIIALITLKYTQSNSCLLYTSRCV